MYSSTRVSHVSLFPLLNDAYTSSRASCARYVGAGDWDTVEESSELRLGVHQGEDALAGAEKGMASEAKALKAISNGCSTWSVRIGLGCRAVRGEQ